MAGSLAPAQARNQASPDESAAGLRHDQARRRAPRRPRGGVPPPASRLRTPETRPPARYACGRRVDYALTRDEVCQAQSDQQLWSGRPGSHGWKSTRKSRCRRVSATPVRRRTPQVGGRWHTSTRTRSSRTGTPARQTSDSLRNTSGLSLFARSAGISW